MSTLRLVIKAAMVMAAFTAFSAQADVKAGVAATSVYDSSVLSDPELQGSQVSAAWGQKYAAHLALSGKVSQHWQWSARYDVNRNVWNDVSGYDSQIQSGYLRVGRRGIWSPELALLGADAHVEGRDFMQLRRVSPALGYLLSKRWFLRTQLDLSDKRFLDYPARDSHQTHGRLMAFWLLDSTRRYLSLQLGLKNEKAEDSLYNYQAWQGRVKWKQKFKTVEVFVNGRAEHRQYDEVRLTLGEARQDMRWRTSVGISWFAGTGFELKAEAGRDIYHSNLDVADYAQNRFEAGVSWAY